MSCPVCFSDMDIKAVYACSHILCIRCATRLIYIMNDEKCPLCLKADQIAFFTDSSDPVYLFNQFFLDGGSEKRKKNTETEGVLTGNRLSFDTRNEVTSSIPGNENDIEKRFLRMAIRTKPVASDRKNVFFSSVNIKHEVEKHLYFICKVCQATFKTFVLLRNHYKEHGKLLCAECVAHRKLFPYEFEVFDYAELKQHKATGDESFKGHVWCIFCSKYFYNSDTAKLHCIKVHEMCVFCDKKRFYRNFVCLESHWKRMHYTCTYPSCIRQKTYVFKFRGEFMRHLSEAHGISEFRIENKVGKDIEFMDPFFKESGCCGSSSNRVRDENITDACLQKRGRDKAGKTDKSTSLGQTFSSNAGAVENILHNNQSSQYPSFLNRSPLLASRAKSQHRLQFLKSRTSCYELVDSLIGKLNSEELGPKQLVAEMKMFMEQREVHKLLMSCICFVDNKKALLALLKECKNQIDFPKYKSKPSKKVEVQKKDTSIGYKVLDLSKR